MNTTNTTNKAQKTNTTKEAFMTMAVMDRKRVVKRFELVSYLLIKVL
jgi:hypothetical protein